MVAALLTIAICMGVGWPLSLLLDRNARLALHLGTSFVLGSAAGGFLLFLLSITHIPWSRATLLIGISLVLAVALAAIYRRIPLARRDEEQQIPYSWKSALSLAIEFMSATVATGYALFATVGPTIEYDFISIWGLKAKEFWYACGIDWQFLENPFNAFAHVDYPILLPLIFDVQTLIRGAWDARWLGALNVAFGVAVLLAVRSFLEDETDDPLFVAAGTLTMAGLAFSPWIGLAEGPLVAAGTMGLLYIRKGVSASNARYVLIGAAFLGIAGSFKNEGIALVIATGAALLFTAPRFLTRLWPSLVLIGPWAFLRRLHHLQGDLITGPVMERIRLHLADPGPMISAMTTYTTGKRFFWIGVILAGLLSVHRVVTRERFLLVALLAQVGCFLIAYLITPHDVTWHVRWSWERIVNQITLPIAFLSLVLLVPLLQKREQPNLESDSE